MRMERNGSVLMRKKRTKDKHVRAHRTREEKKLHINKKESSDYALLAVKIIKNIFFLNWDEHFFMFEMGEFRCNFTPIMIVRAFVACKRISSEKLQPYVTNTQIDCQCCRKVSLVHKYHFNKSMNHQVVVAYDIYKRKLQPLFCHRRTFRA